MGRNIVVTGLMRDIMNESRIGGVNGGAGGSGAREGEDHYIYHNERNKLAYLN